MFKMIFAMVCSGMIMNAMPSTGYGNGSLTDNLMDRILMDAGKRVIKERFSSGTSKTTTDSDAPTTSEALPNQKMTPGVINPEVTQANIQQTVCVKGFTKTIRPPAYYTNKLKKSQIREYGYADTNPKNYEEDHLIALSIGGNPTDEKNLWPQPRNGAWGADKKDRLEFVLYKMVCGNEIPLRDAQRAMSTDWIGAYKVYVPTHQNYRFKGGFD